MRALMIIVAILGSTLQVLAQETKSEEAEARKGSHRFTTGLGHTHLAKGKDAEGQMVWLPVPSWSLDYDYWIGNRWAIGLQTDLVLEKFIVEEEDNKEMEREKPVTLVPVGIFKPYKHFSFIAGAGIELEKEENLGLTRLGMEYGAELLKGWEAGIALKWDNKWGHYNSWVLEFSFSKVFKKKTKE